MALRCSWMRFKTQVTLEQWFVRRMQLALPALCLGMDQLIHIPPRHCALCKAHNSTWHWRLETCKSGQLRLQNDMNVYGAIGSRSRWLVYDSAQTQFALIMGNEGQGMNHELAKMTTKNLYIPISGQAESLNVGVAAGIAMFALKGTLKPSLIKVLLIMQRGLLYARLAATPRIIISWKIC